MTTLKAFFEKIMRRIGIRYSNGGIRYIMFMSFTLSTVLAAVLTGFSFYGRFSDQLEVIVQEENQSLIAQVNRTVDSYLRSIMKLSDSLYYSVIKNADLSDASVTDKALLLYETYKDSVENIALLSSEGELLISAPAARLKEQSEAATQEWFANAMEKTENIHFTTPHVQNLFIKSEDQYKWVVSVSRAVEITQGRNTTQGVLLTDLRYDSIEQLFSQISMGNYGYIYLIDSSGRLIYHPEIQLIDAGQRVENNLVAAGYTDGNYEEVFNGETRIVTVKTVGYTGWKIVGVTPQQGISLNSLKNRLFFFFLTALFILILTLLNTYITAKITEPIQQLEKSVNELERGVLKAEIYQGGSYEIRHLGRSIQRMAKQIQNLMDDIVQEHESKRKSELDTLQAQINPHFLYNTLDIIVWMIENERKTEAVKVVTALARFFRISLSKGKNIITVDKEIEHVRNYLMIQEMRYKNRFTYEITAMPQVLELASLKLILQPIVENAIYHGMEFMDGDGEIKINAFCQDEDLYFSIEDNGLGMPPEVVEGLLNQEAAPASKGSGVGIKNVHQRIQLYFGESYGLIIESEPDEGTKVTVHLPAIPYEDMKEDGR